MNKPVISLSLLMVLTCFTHELRSEEGQIQYGKEYVIKSAYLFGIFGFFTWPGELNADKHLCVLGSSQVLTYLGSINKELTQERQISVLHFPTLSKDIRQCHVLFIAESELEHLTSILVLVYDYPVLTISDIEEFAELGGGMELYKKKKNIRIKLNLDILHYQGLELDPELVQLADIVESKPGVLSELNALSSGLLMTKVDERKMLLNPIKNQPKHSTVNKVDERKSLLDPIKNQPKHSTVNIEQENECNAKLQNCDLAQQQTQFEQFENQVLTLLLSFIKLLALALSALLFLGAAILVLNLRRYFFHKNCEHKPFKH